MNPQEHRDQLVDMLLRELVSEERPPDVRNRVMDAADSVSETSAAELKPLATPTPLASVRPSRWPALAIAAGVTLLGVAGVMLHLQRVATERSPVLTSYSGTTKLPAGRVHSGESLSTGAESSAVLTYQDGTIVELAPDTTIRVTTSSVWDRSKGLDLLSGSFQAEVVPQPEGSPFCLSSRDSRIEVIGTSFSFEQSATRTRLEVSEGTIRFIPHSGEREILVEAGHYAEAGDSGFHHGEIVAPPIPGIIHFTLMDADSDQPMRERPLEDGEEIALSSLPTKRLNIRADYEGDPPASVEFVLQRNHPTNPTGLAASTSRPHHHPPFFVAGDHWEDGRPEDCAAWTPPSGFYNLSAVATYADPHRQARSKPLKIKFRITE